MAFIIDIAGAKLRKARSHVDSILLFAVCRRRAVGDAQSARSAHGEKGDRRRSGRQSLFFPTIFSPSAVVWPGSYTVPGNMGSVVHRCSTFIRIKRSFGYTQISYLTRVCTRAWAIALVVAGFVAFLL